MKTLGQIYVLHTAGERSLCTKTNTKLFFFIVAVGTMAFDERVGLYDDPPNKESVKMINATVDMFKHLGKLSRGWEAFVYQYVTTPTYKKYCEAQDTTFAIGQGIVDKKVMELKKMADEGEAFAEDQG